MTSGRGRNAALIAAALFAVSCKGTDNSASSATAPQREVSLDEAPSARGVIDRMQSLRLKDSASLVPPAPALGFIAQGDRVRAVIPSAERARSVGPVDVELPRRASDDVWIKDLRSGMGVRFRETAAGSCEIAISDGLAVYGAAHAKKSSLYRVHAEGVEDYVLFQQAPSTPELRYELDVSGVAGLRLVSDALELLDREGAPRLRVGRPFLVDAEGERHEARVKVEGCAYDEDPRMPWGRAVTPPGASHCVLSVAWDASAVRYPAVLDPAWTSTCSMSDEYPRHQALRLKDGRVLIVADQSFSGSAYSSPIGDVYDPRTGTWSVTQRQNIDSWAPAAVLADGRVVTSQIVYDPASGQLTPTSRPQLYRYGVYSLTALDNGKAVIFGGLTESIGFFGIDRPEYYQSTRSGKLVFDPVTNTWTWSSSPLPGFQAAGHAAVKLADGRVLLAGGHRREGFSGRYYCNSPPSSDVDAYLTSVYSLAEAAIYDPATDSIVTVAPMRESRWEPQGVLLPSGKVLVVGEFRCDRVRCPPLGGCKAKRNENAAEIYDPTTNIWEPAAPSDLLVTRGFSGERGWPTGDSRGRHLPIAPLVRLLDGSVLLAGAEPSLFDPSTGRWFAAPGYLDGPREHASATLLESGKVLVAGGSKYGSASVFDKVQTSSAELYEGGRLGGACTTGAECASGYCVDGVCCDSECTDLCRACSSAKKGPGSLEGRCGPIGKGADPDSECEPLGSGVCQTPGVCDGAGACLTKVGELLAPKTCADPLSPTPYQFWTTVVFDTCDESGQPVRQSVKCPNGMYCRNGGPLQCDIWACSGSGVDCPGSSCDNFWGYCGGGWDLVITPGAKSNVPGTKVNGSPCSAGTECASKVCSEGVCCDAYCGSCNSCLAARKTTGPDGTCGPVKEGTDPRGACSVSTDCSNSGLCGPNGGCARKPAGSACGETVCQDASTIAGRVCDQDGQCIQGTGSCGAYACGNNVCKVCCASNTDCAPSFVCRECACVPPLPTGQTCTSADQCRSGFCADGRCCDSACSGQCEACDLAGSEGTCSAVTGAPRGSRAACTGASGSPCAGSCNGVERAACSYPSSSTACAPAACTEGSVTTSNCDGQGNCAPTTESCKGYGCEGDQCRTMCTQESDCAPGYACEGSACTQSSDAGDGGETPPPDGGEVDSRDASHDSSGDSASGGSGSGPEEDDGCSVSPHRRREDRWFSLVALAALGVIGARRARRRSARRIDR